MRRRGIEPLRHRAITVRMRKRTNPTLWGSLNKKRDNLFFEKTSLYLGDTGLEPVTPTMSM